MYCEEPGYVYKIKLMDDYLNGDLKAIFVLFSHQVASMYEDLAGNVTNYLSI